MTNYMFWIIAFILNDILMAFMFFRLWRKSFYLHPVFCECGEMHLVPLGVEGLLECSECHVCEGCGHYLTCKTCGKTHLVHKEVNGINFCDAIGCEEKYKRRKKNEKEAV